MAEYQQGETIILHCEAYAEEARTTLTSAATMKLTITHPDGTTDSTVDELSINADDTGEYHYDFDIPSEEGIYIVEWKATYSVGTIIERSQFKVED